MHTKDKDDSDSEYEAEKLTLNPSEKWRILKNITVISIAFMLQFTAFQGIVDLQSSINEEDGLGTISLSIVYAALVISCIFLPTLIIRKLTVKWTLISSMLCYIPYLTFQLYPRFYTLVPSSILLGLGAGPMWASKATYLTQVGQVYAKITEKPVDVIIFRFFGFFFLAWQSAEVWGSLISSMVLSAHGSSAEEYIVSEDDLQNCGASFCTSGLNVEHPPDHEIFQITLIYLSCIAAAVSSIAFFLDPLKRYGERSKGSNPSHEMTVREFLMATFHQMKKVNQLLLIPMTIFIGMEQAAIVADFTQAYVACALGVPKIGITMMCFGAVDAVCSILFGFLMEYVGRIPIIALGAVIQVILILMGLMWHPDPARPLIFFVFGALWGIADAVWQTQISGLYGLLFIHNKEAAFSNYRLWESAGFVIAYAYAAPLCAGLKWYILLTALLLACLGYIIVEILYGRKQRKLNEEEHMNHLVSEGTQTQKVLEQVTENTEGGVDDPEEDIVVKQE